MTREEAIQILADLIDSPFLHTWEKQNKALHMAIEALSADAVQGEWITDRKPTENGTYEWTPITVSEPNTSNHVLVTYKWDEDDYETSELDYWVTRHEAENGNEKCKRLIDHVIAWQSLPTPYKGGDAE